MNELSLCQSWLAKLDRFFGEFWSLNRAVQSHVRNVDQPFILQPLRPLEHPLQADVERAKRGCELNLLLCGQWLTTPHQNAVLVHRRIDLAGIRPGDRPGQIEPCRLGDEDRMQRFQCERHDIRGLPAPKCCSIAFQGEHVGFKYDTANRGRPCTAVSGAAPLRFERLGASIGWIGMIDLGTGKRADIASIANGGHLRRHIALLRAAVRTERGRRHRDQAWPQRTVASGSARSRTPGSRAFCFRRCAPGQFLVLFTDRTAGRTGLTKRRILSRQQDRENSASPGGCSRRSPSRVAS